MVCDEQVKSALFFPKVVHVGPYILCIVQQARPHLIGSATQLSWGPTSQCQSRRTGVWPCGEIDGSEALELGF